MISARVHLADWHRNMDGKLKTLDDLYQILKHDQNTRVCCGWKSPSGCCS